MVSKSIYTPVSQDIEKSINYKSKRPNTLWAKYCRFVVILSGILILILTTVFGLNMAYSHQTTNVTNTTEEVDVVTLNVTDTTLPTTLPTTLNVTDTTLPTTLSVTDTTPAVQDEEETGVVTTLPTVSTTLNVTDTTPAVQDEEETGVVTTLPTVSTTLSVTDTTPAVQDEEETGVVTTLPTDEEETGVTDPLVNPKKIFNMLQEDNGEYTTETDSPEEILPKRFKG
jgi:hypothetical protein